MREPVWNNEWLCLVLAWAWYDLERLHGPDRIAEPVIVVFDVDLAAWHVIQSRLELRVLRLLYDIEQSIELVGSHLWSLVLLVGGLRVWIVQVDGDDLLRNRVFESTCSLICLPPCQVKAIANIVVARSRLFSPLIEQFLRQHGTFLLRDEGAGAAVIEALDWTRAVLADARVRLLEVNVHSDRFHVVKWILLIEWQAEVTLVLHLGAWDMFLHCMWLVLARTDIDSWIMRQHVSILHETLLLRCEVLVENLAVEADHFGHLVGCVLLDCVNAFLVCARTCVLIIELFQFHLAESLLLRSKRHVHRSR